MLPASASGPRAAAPLCSVLIVEDERTVVAKLVEYLEAKGHAQRPCYIEPELDLTRIRQGLDITLLIRYRHLRISSRYRLLRQPSKRNPCDFSLHTPY